MGQEHVTTTLKNALKSGHVSHAYLFTGPKGVGKTSIARILAHEVNNLPYDEITNHLDIIEIDAASNRRIDEIRELRDKIHIAPTSAKYKVYIIDEVHMLTKEAFNALLKTLEEPPEHAIFILATTESHKLPETIISRTQHFAFKPIESSRVAMHLQEIAKNEEVRLDDDAAKLIAEYGEGSFRDSISLLDSLQTGRDHITKDDVRTSIGLAPDEIITNIVDLLDTGDTRTLIQELDMAFAGGYQSTKIAQQLIAAIRNKVINNQAIGEDIKLLQSLLDVSISANPDALLELVLLQRQLSGATIKVAPEAKPTLEASAPPTEPKVAQATEEAAQVKEVPKAKANSDNADLWAEVLMELKQHNNALYGIARMAKADIEPPKLILTLQFPFHLKRLSDTKNSDVLQKIVHNLDPKITSVAYVLADDKPEKKQSSKKPDLKSINDIFGDSEVLES